MQGGRLDVGFALTCGSLQVTRYLGYSSLKDFFPSMDIKPNPGCQNRLCGELQGEHTVRYNSEAAVSARAAAEAAAAGAAAQEVVHEENSWGIAVLPQEAAGSTEEPAHRAPANGSLVEGIEYSMPVRKPISCCSCCCAPELKLVSCQGTMQRTRSTVQVEQLVVKP